jgi:hypothetical protein
VSALATGEIARAAANARSVSVVLFIFPPEIRPAGIRAARALCQAPAKGQVLGLPSFALQISQNMYRLCRELPPGNHSPCNERNRSELGKNCETLSHTPTKKYAISQTTRPICVRLYLCKSYAKGDFY